jgi:hypothetical protein
VGKCKHFEEYIKVEVKAIGKRIEEVRRELCITTGREVTKSEAQTVYMNSFLDGNAKEFRKKWCGKCPDRSCDETDD